MIGSKKPKDNRMRGGFIGMSGYLQDLVKRKPRPKHQAAENIKPFQTRRELMS